MHKFRLSLLTLFFCFSSFLYSAFTEAHSSGSGKENQHCCGKLNKSKCKIKKGFVTIPSRTQSYFTGAPDCITLQENVPSAELYFRIEGKYNPKKPTIVFIHGFGETSDVWLCAQKELCGNFCTVAMDLRGYGRSSKTPAAPPGVADPNGIHYTVDLSTQDVHQLLHALGIKKNLIIVGHSIASDYAIKYTVDHPKEVSKLVLIGGPPVVTPDCAVNTDCATNCFNPFLCQNGYCWPFGITTSTAIGLATPLVNCLGAGGAEKDCLRLWGEFIAPIWFNEPCQNQLKNAQASLVSSVVSMTPAIVTNIFFVAATEDMRKFIPNINVPTLVCVGTIDAVVNPGTEQFYHDNLPNSILAEFEGKGHELHVTDYKNFNKLLKQFVKGKLIDDCRQIDKIIFSDEGCCICPKLKAVNFDKHVAN